MQTFDTYPHGSWLKSHEGKAKSQEGRRAEAMQTFDTYPHGSSLVAHGLLE